MKYKGIKVVLLVIQFVALVFVVMTAIEGLLNSTDSSYTERFTETILRCFAIAVFSLSYFTSISSNSGSESLFIPIFLLSFALSEIRVFNVFARLTNYVIIPPMFETVLFLTCIFLGFLSLIGYGIFFTNRDNETVIRYQISSVVASFVLAYLVPKVSDSFSVMNLLPIRMLTIVFAAIAYLVFIILLINDNDRHDTIRHIAAMMLVTGTFINIISDNLVMNVIGTDIVFVGLLLVTIIYKVNEIKF